MWKWVGLEDSQVDRFIRGKIEASKGRKLNTWDILVDGEILRPKNVKQGHGDGEGEKVEGKLDWNYGCQYHKESWHYVLLLYTNTL